MVIKLLEWFIGDVKVAEAPKAQVKSEVVFKPSKLRRTKLNRVMHLARLL